mgnify:FL=1
MPSQDPLTTIFAEQVKSGMMLDLENDAYADTPRATIMPLRIAM